MLNGDKTTKKIIIKIMFLGGAIEVGVLGLKNGRGWRWSVCHLNDGAISEVGGRRKEGGRKEDRI